MKKWINTSCILGVLLLLSIGAVAKNGTVDDATAYLSHQNQKINQLLVGRNESHIEEQFTPPDDVKPNTSYDKKVTIKNDTDSTCYVRAFVEISDSTIPVNIDFDKVNWTPKQNDGYYYYKTILQPEEKTEPLLTKVSTGSTTEAFKIIVYEETVAARNYQSPQEAFAAIQAK